MAGAEAMDGEAGTEPLVARSDAADRLISADQPLQDMQLACGGEMPGLIAAPDLLELVRKARGFGIRLARPLAMRHADGSLEGWAEVEPDGEGCSIRLSDWHQGDTGLSDGGGEATRLAVENMLAEGVVWLDDSQRVLAFESQAADLEGLVARVSAHRGQSWTRLFDFRPGEGETPPIWQARSGMEVSIEGSSRQWHLLLTQGTAGFLLLLRPIGEIGNGGEADLLPANLLGKALSPALKNPVDRIVRKAEAIRDRLAGPLPGDYRGYAVDIVQAGKHLRELSEELGDAEAIEHGTIDIAVEPVSLRETAEAAARLLQVRAGDRDVTLAVDGENLTAMADRRRLLQICLNILGNAIDYGPRGGHVELRTMRRGKMGQIRIADEGESLSDEERVKIFEKFERLGRSGDSGSGLGLYIALMLARAMGGDIEAEPCEGRGNIFVIGVPLA